jgi:uncharacterized Zn finger protein
MVMVSESDDYGVTVLPGSSPGCTCPSHTHHNHQCYSVVTVLLQGCYSVVTVLLQC